MKQHAILNHHITAAIRFVSFLLLTIISILPTPAIAFPKTNSKQNISNESFLSESRIDQEITRLLQQDSIQLKKFNKDDFLKNRFEMIELYRRIGKLETSYHYIHDTYNVLRKRKEEPPIRLDIFLASVANQLGVRKQSVKYFSLADSILNVILSDIKNLVDNRSMLAMIYAEKGVSVSKTGGLEMSEGFFKKAETIFNQIGDSASAFNQRINIFHTQYQSGKYEKAIETGEKLLSQFKQFDLREREYEIYLFLSYAYHKSGDYKKAFERLKTGSELREELSLVAYSQSLDNLQNKYLEAENALKFQTITEELNKEKQIKNDKQNLIYTLVAISLLITVLLVVVYTNSIRMKAKKKKILDQTASLNEINLSLSNSVREKEDLMKELHHRVKNNFQLMSSFMLLEKKYSKSDSLENFVTKMQLKIHSIAIVHDMLYKEGGKGQIILNDYFNELLEFLIGSADDDDNEVEYSLSGDQVSISLEKAITLGLVLNELITNSIKHSNANSLFIKINIVHVQNEVIIEVSDNGTGFPESLLKGQHSAFLGFKIIMLLFDQLNAKSTFHNKDGAQWQFKVPIEQQ